MDQSKDLNSFLNEMLLPLWGVKHMMTGLPLDELENAKGMTPAFLPTMLETALENLTVKLNRFVETLEARYGDQAVEKSGCAGDDGLPIYRITARTTPKPNEVEKYLADWQRGLEQFHHQIQEAKQ